MQSTPSRRRSKRNSYYPDTPGSGVKTKRLHGLYKDSVWWCNCEPRKKAVLKEVTDEKSPNLGRLFWKCNFYPFCDFFLWREAAKVRERVSASTAASEDPFPSSASSSRPPPPTQRQQRSAPAPPPSSAPTSSSSTSSRPRKPSWTQKSLVQFGFTPSSSDHHATTASDDERAVFSSSDPAEEADDTMSFAAAKDRLRLSSPTPSASKEAKGKGKRKRNDDDDEFGEPWGSDDEQQLANITDEAVRLSASKPTPFTGVSEIGGLSTPSVARNLFSTALQPHGDGGGGNKRSRPTVTFRDTPELFQDALAQLPSSTQSSATITSTPDMPSSSGIFPTFPSASSASQLLTDDTATEVLDLLREKQLDEDTLRLVREKLELSARKTRGAVLARESARNALGERNKRIALLEKRLRALEGGQ